MGIGYRIKEARENLGFTQTELGKLVGVTGSSITNYENETSHPKEPVMYKLIEALKVDANYLFQDCVKLPKDSNDITLYEYDIIKKYRFIKEQSPDGLQIVDATLNREYSVADQMLKQSSEIKKLKTEISAFQNNEQKSNTRVIQYYQRLASAGTGEVVFEDSFVDRIEIPDIPKYKRVSYALSVNGHSMEPLYNDGDMLLVEPICQIDVGEIGIFIVGEKAFVKKLGKTELISLNKGYDNIPLSEDTKCMGRVVDKL